MGVSDQRHAGDVGYWYHWWESDIAQNSNEKDAPELRLWVLLEGKLEFESGSLDSKTKAGIIPAVGAEAGNS
jgi:hypothetical protein